MIEEKIPLAPSQVPPLRLRRVPPEAQGLRAPLKDTDVAPAKRSRRGGERPKWADCAPEFMDDAKAARVEGLAAILRRFPAHHHEFNPAYAAQHRYYCPPGDPASAASSGGGEPARRRRFLWLLNEILLFLVIVFNILGNFVNFL